MHADHFLVTVLTGAGLGYWTGHDWTIDKTRGMRFTKSEAQTVAADLRRGIPTPNIKILDTREGR